MQRDPSLIPLSHQHHNGLALCVMTRRALAADSSDSNVSQQARRIIDRFEIELVNHFEMEEQLLFPAAQDRPLIEQLVSEHRQLEKLVAMLREQPAAALIEEFCALLSSHIRMEEKQLFEAVQRELPRQELDRIGAEIDTRAVRVCL